jgi:hypothetical protein
MVLAVVLAVIDRSVQRRQGQSHFAITFRPGETFALASLCRPLRLAKAGRFRSTSLNA